MMKTILAALFSVVLLSQGVVFAHPAGSEFHDWFMTLKQPDSLGKPYPPISCCGEADQFYATKQEESEVDPHGLRAYVENYGWLEVPGEKINWNESNPTGRPVIYISGDDVGHRMVLCYIPANGS